MAEYTPIADFAFSAVEYTPGADFELGAAGSIAVTAQLGALLQATLARQAGLSALLVKQRSADLGLNALLNPPVLQAGLDAVTVRNNLLNAALGALLQTTRSADVGMDAVLSVFDRRHVNAWLDAAIVATATRQHTALLSGVLQKVRRMAAYPDCAPLLGVNATVRTRRVRLDANVLPGVDMALSFSTGLRNHLLGRYAHENGDGLGGAMHNCYIDIYSGAKPASPDYPPVPGTYLGTVSQGGYPGPDWGGSWREPEGGAIEKSRTEPWVMYGVREGVAGWFRMRLIDDLNDYSTTAHRIDGTIVEQEGQGDLVMPNRTVSVGSRHDIHIFRMIMRQDN